MKCVVSHIFCRGTLGAIWK